MILFVDCKVSLVQLLWLWHQPSHTPEEPIEIIHHLVCYSAFGQKVFDTQDLQAFDEIILIHNKKCVSKSGNKAEKCAMLFAELGLEPEEEMNNIIFDTLSLKTQ